MRWNTLSERPQKVLWPYILWQQLLGRLKSASGQSKFSHPGKLATYHQNLKFRGKLKSDTSNLQKISCRININCLNAAYQSNCKNIRQTDISDICQLCSRAHGKELVLKIKHEINSSVHPPGTYIWSKSNTFI